GLGGGEALEVRRPVDGVVAQSATHLDRVLPEVRDRQLDKPATMVDRRRQALQNFRLNPLISGDFRHSATLPFSYACRPATPGTGARAHRGVTLRYEPAQGYAGRALSSP